MSHLLTEPRLLLRQAKTLQQKVDSKREKNHTYLSLKHKNVITYNSIGVKLLEMDPSKCLLTSSPFDSPLKNTLILSLDETFTCEPLIDLSYDLPLILIT